MLKAICFDVDGTLYRQGPVRRRMALRLVLELALGRVRLSDLRAIQAYRSALERGRSYGRVEDLQARLLEDAASAAGVPVERLEELVKRWIYEEPLVVLEQSASSKLRQMLVRLRVRGYRLGVLSDYPAERKLEALGLPAGLFDAVVEARDPQVNALKPHGAGFAEMARRLGVRAEEILYVGDRDEIDGEGARRAGMGFVLCGGEAAARSRRIANVLEIERCVPTTANGGVGSHSQAGCWICGSGRSSLYLRSSLESTLGPQAIATTGSDYGKTAELRQCLDCGFIRADENEALVLQRFYAGMRDEEYEFSAASRVISFEQLLQKMRTLRPNAKTLLEIGAGTGMFCEAARRSGLGVEGVEPSAWAVEQAAAIRELRLIQGYFPDVELGEKEYDIVVATDVIEHVSDPVGFLRGCAASLAPGGLIVLVTPDIESIGARLFGKWWWHFRPAHIGYFTRAMMTAAIGAAGLSLQSDESFVRWFELRYILARVRPRALGRMLDFLLDRIFRAGKVKFPVSAGDSRIYVISAG